MNSALKCSVPLEEALRIAGSGTYTNYVILTMGMNYLSSLLTIQGMAVVMPFAGCDMQLTNGEKGILNSMSFLGMVFSAQLFGFLADTYGRKRIMQICLALNMITITCWSLAPDPITLGVMLFLNGFIVTGAITPGYVSVSEFCPAETRARMLVAHSAIGAVANVFLPSLAWLVTPLDVHLPIYNNLEFTSWRLVVILLVIPVLISFILLWPLPETPKFLLSQGKVEKTLEVLKSMYEINQKKNKEEFPVLSIYLDSPDEESHKAEVHSNQFLYFLKKMANQTIVLFSKQYFLYTLCSCFLFFGVGAMYNTLLLWYPEQTSRIRHYSESHDVYDVTICNIMKSINAPKAVNCQLNFDFLSASIIIGLCQVISNLTVAFCTQRIRKRKVILATVLFLSAALIFFSIFLTFEFLIIASFGYNIIALFLMFPISVSLVVELFPTPLRSTATSITMTCLRLGAAMGSQLMGILFENHCRKGYFGMSFILFVTSVLCILLPKKKAIS